MYSLSILAEERANSNEKMTLNTNYAKFANSEYQGYFYEEYKNGSDEKEIIRKFGKPSELVKKPMLYFGMFFYLLSLLQSLFVFLLRDRRYFSMICHGFGGVFSVLFLFHQYYNFDSASNLLNPILPALGIYFVGLAAGGLFHFLYDNMAKNRRVSNRMKDGGS